MLLVARLTGHILTFGQRLILANLIGNRNTNFLWNRDAALLWFLMASLIGNLPGVGFLHVLALVVGNILASSIDGSPHLVVALTLPLVLAILLVLGGALSFWKRTVKFDHNGKRSNMLIHTHTKNREKDRPV